jgi:hypothetical protein
MAARRLGRLVGIWLLLGLSADAQSGSRVVHLQIFPTKDSPATPLTVRENETLIVTVKELGTLGFEVRFQDRQEKLVLVVVFDAETSPHTLLGATDVPVDGKRVESNTSPPFGIRIRRIEVNSRR